MQLDKFARVCKSINNCISNRPKSPPNSPNTEPVGEGEELKGFYINYCSKVFYILKVWNVESLLHLLSFRRMPVLRIALTGFGTGPVVLSNKRQSKSFLRLAEIVFLTAFVLIFFREWKFIHPEGRIPMKKPYGYSIRFAKVGGTSVFSRQVLYTMVITNLISLLLGTGIG